MQKCFKSTGSVQSYKEKRIQKRKEKVSNILGRIAWKALPISNLLASNFPLDHGLSGGGAGGAAVSDDPVILV